MRVQKPRVRWNPLLDGNLLTHSCSIFKIWRVSRIKLRIESLCLVSKVRQVFRLTSPETKDVIEPSLNCPHWGWVCLCKVLACGIKTMWPNHMKTVEPFSLGKTLIIPGQLHLLKSLECTSSFRTQNVADVNWPCLFWCLKQCLN